MPQKSRWEKEKDPGVIGSRKPVKDKKDAQAWRRATELEQSGMKHGILQKGMSAIDIYNRYYERKYGKEK